METFCAGETLTGLSALAPESWSVMDTAAMLEGKSRAGQGRQPIKEDSSRGNRPLNGEFAPARRAGPRAVPNPGLLRENINPSAGEAPKARWNRSLPPIAHPGSKKQPQAIEKQELFPLCRFSLMRLRRAAEYTGPTVGRAQKPRIRLPKRVDGAVRRPGPLPGNRSDQ